MPLAIAGTITGNLLAYSESKHLNMSVFLFSVLTAVLLQILSNFANDYGDYKNGADTAERTDRVMASGLLSEQHMKNALIVLILATLTTGILLLYFGIRELNTSFFVLLILGIAGILAAYFYTAGKNPYGYIGLGDVSVFLFFGLLAVVGTFYLQTQSVASHIWWVGAAIGLLSVGVLNVNNIRDIESDKSKNKITIPVILGY
ncbi:MAG: 1,4-dihydroxy-2-naphthoate octaprenyltransferase, partial [Bacteroidetes bacterium]|nr:1,4-dihydroxy-2-naphthoate octaprenyltransferase [Bacteroidota bacterium]